MRLIVSRLAVSCSSPGERLFFFSPLLRRARGPPTSVVV
jgi:hypothetical protein